MLYDDNKIEEVNYQIYLKWFDEFAQETKLDGIIYVHTEPTVCYDRIKKRSRTGEESIPLDYLENVISITMIGFLTVKTIYILLTVTLIQMKPLTLLEHGWKIL